jgi:hypothetical protein
VVVVSPPVEVVVVSDESDPPLDPHAWSETIRERTKTMWIRLKKTFFMPPPDKARLTESTGQITVF